MTPQAPKVLECGCVDGWERCMKCRPGLDPKAPVADAVRLLSERIATLQSLNEPILPATPFNVQARNKSEVKFLTEVLAALSPAPGADREALVDVTCQRCHGAGEVDGKECHACAGDGSGLRAVQRDSFPAWDNEASARAALAAQPVVGDAWQDIETAPKDRRIIGAVFGQHEDAHAYVIMRWSRLSEAWYEGFNGSLVRPTHWTDFKHPVSPLSRQSVQGEEDSIGHRDSRGSPTAVHGETP